MVFEATIRVRRRGLKKAASEFRKTLSMLLRDIGDAVLFQADINVPRVQGGLAGSGERIPGRVTDWVIVRYTAPYAAAVHEGSAPHWPPPEVMEPGGELYRWVELVILPGGDEKEIRKIAYAIGATIAAFGGIPQPWLRDAWEKTVRPKVDDMAHRRFEEASARLEAEFGGG